MDDGTLLAPLPIVQNIDTIVINGKGFFKMPSTLSTLNNLDASIFKYLEVFKVEPNKYYLFRVIGANAGHPLEIRVGGHKMTIIASDGNKIKPIKDVDSLIVNSGERYDFYIKTKSTNTTNYYIAVKTLETLDYDFKKRSEINYAVAILEYTDVNKIKPICSDACTACDPSRRCRKVNCPFWPKINDGPYECIPVGLFKSLVTPADKSLFRNTYTSNEFEEYFLNFSFCWLYSTTFFHKWTPICYAFESAIFK